ncbi:MAG: hypothetical protein M1591_04300 [Deltaproteobacteria bacterium]|nr:hypothetical protein [Deltaproteobacteria bacterium]
MNRLRSSFIVFIILLTGCSVVTRNAASNNFKNTIDDNAKRISIERDFSVVLSMDVIHINDQVRKAYVDEYARLYLLSTKEKNKMLQQQMEQDKQWEAFYLIVYTAPGIESSLDSTDSLWKMYLDAGGTIEPPVSVDEINAQRDFIKGFFPWISSWDTVYLVRFKKQQPGYKTGIKFIVTGILGKGETDF